MLKACSKCGKIHAYNYECKAGYTKRSFNDRQDKEASRLRSLSSWQKKRASIKERAFNLCEVCKAQGIYNYTDIEIHHIKKLSEDPDGLLDDNNLVALCTLHHKQADKGIISVDDLKKLVALRDSKDYIAYHPPTS